MDKVTEFPNTVIAVTPSDLVVLVDGSPELVKLMDGAIFDDNSFPETLKRFPHEPGVYLVTIEYWFEQGYFEGYKADGESDLDFAPADIRKIDVIRLVEMMRHWIEANGTMGFPDADQNMWDIAEEITGLSAIPVQDV